eukprot:5218640-Alexandrium_andersonii.AAC.1
MAATKHAPTGKSAWTSHNLEIRLPKSTFRPGALGSSKSRPPEVGGLTSEVDVSTSEVDVFDPG